MVIEGDFIAVLCDLRAFGFAGSIDNGARNVDE